MWHVTNWAIKWAYFKMKKIQGMTSYSVEEHNKWWPVMQQTTKKLKANLSYTYLKHFTLLRPQFPSRRNPKALHWCNWKSRKTTRNVDPAVNPSLPRWWPQFSSSQAKPWQRHQAPIQPLNKHTMSKQRRRHRTAIPLHHHGHHMDSHNLYGLNTMADRDARNSVIARNRVIPGNACGTRQCLNVQGIVRIVGDCLKN